VRVVEVPSPAPSGTVVLQGGEPINFAHGAVVGPALRLVQGEVLVAAAHIATGRIRAPGLQELPDEERLAIADIWMQSYYDDPAG